MCSDSSLDAYCGRSSAESSRLSKGSVGTVHDTMLILMLASKF